IIMVTNSFNVHYYERYGNLSFYSLNGTLESRRAGRRDLRGLTRTNRAKISSSHKGCQEINSALKTFLGRDELQFEVEKDGYVLMRNKKVAENLSEGERTAIGFVHFVIHLKDQDFDLAHGIVVDDPVSSLDANSHFAGVLVLKKFNQGSSTNVCVDTQL